MMAESNRSDAHKRKHQLPSSSSQAEVSSSTSTSSTVTNEEDVDEEEAEQINEIEDVGNAHKRRRLGASAETLHPLTKDTRPQQQLRSSTKQTRDPVPRRMTVANRARRTRDHEEVEEEEEEQEEEEEAEEEEEEEGETENEEEAQQQQASRKKQKLRTPFRPPEQTVRLP